MKVTYKGNLDTLIPAERRKLDAKLQKLAKVVDGREEREAHFVIAQERQNYRAEITVNIRDHVLVGEGAAPDLYTAMSSAIEKLDKQVRKLRAKFRDTRRTPDQSLRAKAAEEEAGGAVEGAAGEAAELQVFRVNHRANQKPMTLEEALLAMEGRNYLVYRDAETDRLSVLLRREDGNFDLVEA